MKRDTATRARIFLLIAGLLVPPSLLAQVYRWTDAAGQVHYTQTPPPGKAVKSLEQAPPPAASPGVVQMKKFNEQAAKAAAELAQTQADQKLAREKAEAACTRARSALSTLESRPPSRIARKDAEGQLVRMTPDEHAALVAKSREQAEQNCP